MLQAVEVVPRVGIAPWRDLGTKISPHLTPEKMLIAAGLDWRVELYPIFAEVGRKRVIAEDKKMLVRRSADSKLDKTPLAIVGDKWIPTQNLEAFKYFSEFGVQLHTAGSLKNGRRVWALARILDQNFTILGKDKVEAHLLFSLPHIYGASIDIRFVPIRLVSYTTQAFYLNDSDDLTVSLTHRRKFDPEFVENTIELARRKLAEYKTAAIELSHKHYTEETVKKYLARVYPWMGANHETKLGKSAQKAYEILYTQPGASIAPRSWWQAYNAAIYTADHLLGRGPDSRLEAAWYGLARRTKIEALNLALKFAQKA